MQTPEKLREKYSSGFEQKDCDKSQSITNLHQMLEQLEFLDVDPSDESVKSPLKEIKDSL